MWHYIILQFVKFDLKNVHLMKSIKLPNEKKKKTDLKAFCAGGQL